MIDFCRGQLDWGSRARFENQTLDGLFDISPVPVIIRTRFCQFVLV